MVAGALTALRHAYVTIIHQAVTLSLASVCACLDGMVIAANKASRLRISFFELFDIICMHTIYALFWIENVLLYIGHAIGNIGSVSK